MAASDLRQQLRERRDVPDADIDDIIELAQKRQDEQRAATEGRATVEEIEAIAAELDIAPEHVEAAIGDLRRQREQAEAQQQEAARVQALRQRQQGVLVRKMAIGTGIVMLGLSLLTGGLALSGRGAVLQAHREVAAAQARVDAAISRQASLAPQVAGLAGARADSLAAMQAAVRDGPDLTARLAAADALTTELATRLGQLPPAATDAEATARLNLQDELTGSQNRVTTELRRYNDAVAEWEAAADTLGGGLAVGLGLVEGP